jgi:hypothetical protein
MALFIKQDEQRSQLQEKIAADLASRLNSQPIEPSEPVQSTLLDNQHQSSPLLWLWLLLFVLGALVIGWLLFYKPR